MPIEMFTALVIFASAMAFTPGPNNVMVTASGVNFGFRRTLPHILGITFGFVVLLVGCAAGLGAIFTAYPPLQIVLKAAGAIYLLWLAWKIATAKPAADDDERVGRPITFLQAALFQWVNPKAVVIARHQGFRQPGQGALHPVRGVRRHAFDSVVVRVARPAVGSAQGAYIQCLHGLLWRQHRRWCVWAALARSTA